MIKMQANPNAESIPLKCAESTDSTVCGWRWLSRCAEESDLASSKQQWNGEIKMRMWAFRLVTSFFFITKLNSTNEGALES